MGREFSAALVSLVLYHMGIQIVDSRPAETSLCARYPTAIFCRTKRQSQPSTHRDNSDAVYCTKWEKHYDFYCIGLGSGDRRASEFCPYYKTTCNIKQKPSFVTPPPLPSQQRGNNVVPASNANGNPFQPLPTPAPAPEQPHQPLFPKWNAASQPQPQPQPQPAPVQGNTAGLTSGGGLSSIGQPLAFLGGQNSAAAGSQPFGVPSTGNAPLSIGQGFGVGPFANAVSATNINPLSGVSTGTNVNAAGLPISATRGVSFGGLIPGGLSNLFGR